MRNPFLVWLVSLLTVGAYGIYWHYRTNEELRERGELVRPALSALAVSWGALLVVPAFISCYTTARRVRSQCREKGHDGPSPILALVLLPVYPAYVQAHLNRL